jgi:GDP-4-dehydro-6-deoxy-D-mannose reductase
LWPAQRTLTRVKKLLATGHRGFVGTALREFLQSHSDAPAVWCPLTRESDLLDPTQMRAMIDEHQPDWVVHLAAQSHVPQSWSDPAHTLQVNVCGTANLLNALSEAGFRGRLLYVSSADVYGSVQQADLPVTEEAPAAPRSPYASSKVAAEVLCRQWAGTRGLDVVIARPFNHTGPGQRLDFALPRFAREIAAIKLGRQAPQVLAGDLDVTRDFLDVRDVVNAYLALLARGRSKEIYNVCSSSEVHMGDALRRLAEMAGVQAEIATDPARFRPAEQRRMCGRHAKITADTGWVPRIPLDETLQQLLDHWTRELDA